MKTERKHDIFLGDLVRAFDSLQPTDEASRRLIAQLLGFDIKEAKADRRLDVSPKIDGRDKRTAPSPKPEEKPLPVLPVIEPELVPLATSLAASTEETFRPLVYISHHALEDSAREVLNAIHLRLFEDGFDVLLDSTRLQPGSAWSEQMKSWLDLCHGVVMLFSESALTSPQVTKEFNDITQRCASDKDLVVVPVLLPPVTRNDLRQRSYLMQQTDVIQARTSEAASSIAAKVSQALTPLLIDEENWKPDVSPLPPLVIKDSNIPLPFDPLLVPNWTRAMMSAALATSGGDGVLDINRIVERLARKEHLKRLPMRPFPTLTQGVQILVDMGPSMIPYARDQAWLQNEVQKVVGYEKAQALRFVGTPLRGAGIGERSRWAQYQPPASGTPVLLLTDLGICHSASSADWTSDSDWQSFAEVVKRAGCPLIAFVPYAPSRWPRSLARSMILIQWDRPTTIATVRSLVRRAREVIR
jgi:hypothetical protein